MISVVGGSSGGGRGVVMLAVKLKSVVLVALTEGQYSAAHTN
jgi:hypothetical protein